MRGLGPVDQVEVDVLGAQSPQAALEPRPCPVAPVVAVPHLRRHEHLFACEAAACNRVRDAGLVVVRGGCVDRAVARIERLQDRVGGLLGRDLEHAESELRDPVAVVHLQQWD
jgi:hypothetical protein